MISARTQDISIHSSPLTPHKGDHLLSFIDIMQRGKKYVVVVFILFFLILNFLCQVFSMIITWWRVDFMLLAHFIDGSYTHICVSTFKLLLQIQEK